MTGTANRKVWTRRGVVEAATSAVGIAVLSPLLGACAAPPAPAPTAAPTAAAAAPAPAPTAAPAAAKAPAAQSKPKLSAWIPKHFIPEEVSYMTESLTLAGTKGGFDVEVESYPMTELNQKYSVAIEAKTVPDVSVAVDVPRYVAMDLLADVSDIFKEVGDAGGGWFDPVIRYLTVNGKQYGVHVEIEPNIGYYRKDLIEKAGFKLPIKSLDEFVEVCKALTKPADNIWGFGQSYGTVGDSNGGFYPFLWAFGGRVLDEKNEVVLDSDITAQALQFYTDLYTKHKIVPPGATGWDDTGNNKAWLSSQAAIIYNSGSIVKTMRDENKDLLEKTTLGAMPAGPSGPQANVGSMVNGSTVVFKASKYQDQGRQMIKSVVSEERYMGNLKAAGGMFFPSRKKYANDPFYTDDRWNKETAAVLPVAKEPFFAGTPSPWYGEFDAQALWAKSMNKIVTGASTVKAEITELTKQLKDLKAKYANR